MDGFAQAKELVRHATEHLERIRVLNNKCLAQKEVKTPFLIEIKNYMENLRSALDYVANALFAKYNSSTKANPRIYFPYAPHSQSLAEFREKKRIESCIPRPRKGPARYRGEDRVLPTFRQSREPARGVHGTEQRKQAPAAHAPGGARPLGDQHEDHDTAWRHR